MKKIYSVVFSLLISLLSFAQSTVSTTVYYTGFQACGGCTVCGMDYWCFNTWGSYCGNTGPCGTQTFFDPVPAGNLVTNIQVQYFSAECNGGSLTATINGNSVPSVNEGATGCWCSNNPCAMSAASSGNYPCGMPGYVYGGNNTLQLCTGADVCVNKIVLIITYYLPSAINPSITASGPTNFCAGGSVVLDAGAPYAAYSWNTGANTQTINVTTAGTYVVTVTSLSGCTTGSASMTVNVFASPTPVITGGPLVFCSGGSVVLDAGAGYSGYAWSTGAGTQTISVSTSGTYGVTVTDGNGCVGYTSINVNVYNSPTVSATATLAGCGVANGTATANPSGGTPGYTYLWSDGQITQTAVGLTGGIYNVTVTDANGCTAQTSITVSSTNAPTVSATSTPAGCSVANGSATANPSGGTLPYTYLWSNGDPNQTANNLAPGTYTVTVTDANGCAAVTTITITGTAAPTTVSTVTNVLCNGGNSQTANGLTVGTYSVIVTDANGCSVVDIVTITEPAALALSPSQTNILCNGGSTGTAAVAVAGGTTPYTYLWNNGQTTVTATGLGAGNYQCTVTDANGCSSVTSVTITQPVALSTFISQTNITCSGGSDGTATATVSNGTSPYTYLWSNSQTTQTATGFSAGNYTVVVTDANGCTNSTAVTVNPTQPLAGSVLPTNPLCNLGNNGTATVNMTNGTSPYTYLWSNTQTVQTATGLIAGNYSVFITDANGCTAISSTSLTEPPAINLSASGSADSICMMDSINLTANVSGGTPTYTFIWQPDTINGASVTVTPSTTTTYTLAVTDANGCTASASATATIFVFPAPTALFDTTSNGSYSSVFSFDDLSTGGSTSWFWDFGDGSTSTLQNPVHSFPGSGTYTVTQVVLNQYGCPDTFTIIIDFKDGILIPNVFTPDGDGMNDVWYIPNSGMEEFHVEIFDRWGAKVFETTADEIRWDGRSTSGKLLNDGTYFFSLKAILKSGSDTKDYSTTGYVSLLTGKR